MNPEKPNVTKKIDHSGNLPDDMREEPINDFDNTTLEQAVNQNLIDVPKNVEAFDGWTPSTELKPGSVEKKGYTKRQKLITAVSGALLLLGIGGGVTATIANQSQPVAETPANPAEDPEEQTPVEAPVEALDNEVDPVAENPEVNASLLSNPESLAKTFFEEKIQSWFNAGATPENYVLFSELTDGTSQDDFASKLASINAKTYADALFAPGWENNQEIVDYVNRMEKVNKDTIFIYIITTPGEYNKADKEAYARYAQVDSVDVLNSTDTSLTLTINQHESDNSDKNRVGEDVAPAVDPNNTGSPTITWTIVGDALKVSNFSPYS